jgi:hypothetical protein
MILKIPILYIKDKQVFRKENGILRLVGKPLDVAKQMKKEGYKLIHFIDADALAGLSNNLDIYDGLTYFINIQVECAPNLKLVSKLITLKCRVVLDIVSAEASLKIDGLNKNLLVAKIPKGAKYSGNAESFRDVILEEFDEKEAKRFEKLGKRIIIYKTQDPKPKTTKVGDLELGAGISELVWGVLSNH